MPASLPLGLTPHEFIRANPGAVVIAGSRYAASDLVRKACDSALLGIQRYTFRGLVYTLSTDAMNARGLTPLSRIASEAIAASLARQVELKYLHDVVRFPGFPAALANTLSDLRLDRVPLSKLRDTGRSGADLATLLEAYEAELGRLDFADYPFRIELAIERARAIPSAPVLLLGLELQTVAERELRDTLVSRAPAHVIAGCSEAPGSPANALQAVRRFALSGDRARSVPPTGASLSFQPPAKRSNSSRSRAARCTPRSRSTRSPSCCATRAATSRWSARRCSAPESRPTIPVEPSTATSADAPS